MFSTRVFRVGVCAFLLCHLAACSFAPVYTRPPSPVPPAVAGDGAPRDGEAFVTGWRDFFHDPRLRQLIAASLEYNRDLKVAVFAVAEAGARYRVQRADRLPSLQATGSGDYKAGFEDPQNNTGLFEKPRATEAAPEQSGKNAYEVGATGSFELDFFGRIKSLSDAALENYLATAEAAKTVRLLLVAQVAQGYLDECLARERREIAKDTLKSRQSSYAFIERRVQSGQSSLLELEQARSLVESAAAAVAQSEREVAQAANALQLLTGTYADSQLPDPLPLTRQSLAALPQGVMSEILLARPDIMEAEHKLKAANADIGAARAAFFPSITLVGNMGYQSDDLDNLFSYSKGFWSFLPKVTLPLFTAGRNTANLDAAEARKQSAVAGYEKTVQTAFREVADALQSRESYAGQYAAQTRFLASQSLVLELAQNRYINGAVSYLEILDAQRNVFQSRQDVLGTRRDQLLNEISLYRALGGGLSEHTDTARIDAQSPVIREEKL
ncbi:MAG: efflux transporter outer membrane subunit [Desulfovibrio sp.]|jgi:NodT family efflux transporter outer membrane factor (OMF) lipoprotein|nr:efflux transporter outer membrane subunit [Desulfovibrio sp.]